MPYNDYGFNLNRVFDFGGSKPINTKQAKFNKKTKVGTKNLFWDGLEGNGDFGDLGNLGFSGFKGTNEFAEGNFFKYVPNMIYKAPSGMGKESKKSKARRTVTQAESPVYYGLESLENTLGDSYTNLEKNAKQIRINVKKGSNFRKSLAKKNELQLRIPRKIKEKYKSFQAKRTLSRFDEIEPEITPIRSDKSKEISEAYGTVVQGPYYPRKRNSEFDEETRERFK